MRTLSGSFNDGTVAFIKLAIERSDAPGSGADSASAVHALMVQRVNVNGQPDSYYVTDPNNGMFQYDSPDDMRGALTDYMRAAYRTGWFARRAQ
jgi:hypothetical protein